MLLHIIIKEDAAEDFSSGESTWNICCRELHQEKWIQLNIRVLHTRVFGHRTRVCKKPGCVFCYLEKL